MRRPIGSSSGQNRRAICALMTTTGGASAPSRAVKARPRTSGTPITRK
jgi:hypothetical protein